jgi:hypothetical protein
MRSLSPALLSIVFLGACGGAPPPEPAAAEATAQPAAKAPPPEEAATPEWEVAAKSATGDGACTAVRAAITAEKACAGSLCAHGAALAKEWARRCGGDAALAAEIAERAKKPASDCGKRAEKILESGCERDATCERTASRWAAHCAKSDGSPLLLGLLGRAVAKRSALPEFTIDARSCDDLRADLKKGVACDRASCPAALKTAEAFRMRCEGEGDPPDAVTALLEAAVMSTAGKPGVATLVRPNPPKLTPADLPVLLGDRYGAAAAVCGEGLADVAAYVAKRRACAKGKVAFVRMFVNSVKDYDVRAGLFDAPDDETFARRFPSLRVLGEIEARDAAAKQALAVELPKVAALAKDAATVPEAARALGRLAREHGKSILRSAEVRAAFAAVDEDLAPVLAAIGKAKLAAADKLEAGELAVVAARAPKHPFADLGEQGGASSLEARSVAARIEGAALFPAAMKAYTAALGNLAALARKKPFSTADARETKAHAVEVAKGCVEAAKRAEGEEKELVACAFTMNTCDPGKVEALTRALDEDRNAMVAARHTIDLARSVLGSAARGEIEKAAKGCELP